jgi:hypothetical protein
VLQYHFIWNMLSVIAGVTWCNFYFWLFPEPFAARAVWTLCNSRRDACGWSFPGLCAGTEPGRVSAVTLETARVAQLPPHRVW